LPPKHVEASVLFRRVRAISRRIRHEGEALLREQGGRAEGETHLEALASNPDLENFLRLVP